MINLAGKSVFVKTQEEYLSVLKMAKLQGFTWGGRKPFKPYRNPDPEQDLGPTDWCTNVTDAEASELGKTVFLTREEAEKKLEELRN